MEDHTPIISAIEAYRHAPAGVLLFGLSEDDALVILGGNAKAEQLLGTDIEAASGTPCSGLWPHLDEACDSVKAIAMNGPDVADPESPLRVSFGIGTGGYLVVGKPFPVSQGVVGMMLEEDDGSEAEVDWKTAFIESNPNIIGIAAADTSILYLNPAAYEQVGAEPGDIECIADAQPELPEEAIGAVMGEAGYWIGEAEFKRQDGTMFPVHQVLTAVRNQAGELLYLTTICRDITAEKELEAEREWMSRIIETSPYVIGIATPDAKMLYANPATHEMTGYGPGEIDHIGTVQPELPPGAMEALMRDGVWDGETEFQRKDGSRMPVHQVMTAVKDDQGHMLYITCIAQDISAWKEAEGKLIEQGKAIMELSTPVISLWEGILLLPLVGALDTERTQQMTERLLDGVVRTNARVAILDVTGIPVMDTSVARHLLTAVEAAHILGSEVIVTGFGADAAQTLAHLGVDFSALRTRGSLRAGIREAFAMIGHDIALARR